MSLVKLVAVGGAGLLLGFMLNRHSDEPLPMPDTSALEKKIVDLKNDLLGYTSYETYLTAAKSSIESQAKLITGKVTRQERVTAVVDKALMPWIKTRTIVEISYQAEYTFGFDLNSKRYSIRNAKAGNGIEIVVGRPVMLATPGTSRYGYRVLSEDAFADGNRALNKLFQRVPIWAGENGKKIAATPEIQALCEKALIDFVRGFLQKQPNVKSIPQITIVYSK